jgi:endonuclease YncB( thermonuclease family)
MRRRTARRSDRVVPAGSVLGVEAGGAAPSGESALERLEFDSTASLLNAGGEPLTDESTVAVWAESTARNRDADGDGDAVRYDASAPIPLVAVDGDVVGLGATLVSDEANFRSDNEQFLLNVWDAHLGGSGTVLYDRSHGQYHPLGDFRNARNYAERNGYTVKTTNALEADLAEADAVWITAPDDPFTEAELRALSAFRSGGGAVFLHDRADYRNFDRTANLNAIAAALSLSFRFNDDQVVDDANNGGAFYKPTTTRFHRSFDYFGARPGIGIDPTTTHAVTVVAVSDGDTVQVRFDSGRVEPVRVLGVDTPEKTRNREAERVVEWEGVHDLDYLGVWGQNATNYAAEVLTNERATLAFDPGEPEIFDGFGRLLGYLWYDSTGNGVHDAFYNRELVAKGYARVYASSFTYYDAFAELERLARAERRNLWGESDPAGSSAFRNRDAEELFVPKATAVTTADGPLPDDRAAVYAESTAVQAPADGYAYGEESSLPLVGVDPSANVGMVGGLVVDERYERAEGFAVDTAAFENFVVLTNLATSLSDGGGSVRIDGGHGQFGADWSLAAEDVAYYQRHLEGVDVGFEQVNELNTPRLATARALVVSAPRVAFSETELDALRSFTASGGALVLVGGSTAPDDAIENLNAVAAGVGSNLRLNGGSVTDSTNNLAGDATIPTTTAFDASFPLFSAYRPGDEGRPLVVSEVRPRGDAPTDEYVRFENGTGGRLDLTGWTVSDRAGHEFAFPDGFTLEPGSSVALHTGTGEDADGELYWGREAAVWNDAGDTVLVFDETGAEVLRESY